MSRTRKEIRNANEKKTRKPGTDNKLSRRLFNSLEIAGPNDPIYSSGLTMTSVRKPKPSSKETNTKEPSQPVRKKKSEKSLEEMIRIAGDNAMKRMVAERKARGKKIRN